MKENVPLVLLVEDEPVMCNVMRRILQMNGYRVIVAPNGIIALEMTKKSKPALVVLDIGLPMADRRELSARLRENADCRIIYFTSINNKTINERAKELYGEVDAFITRPTSMKKILAVVGSTLGDSQRLEEARV